MAACAEPDQSGVHCFFMIRIRREFIVDKVYNLLCVPVIIHVVDVK